jgi:uncharacterized protein (DUF58 family)
MRITRKIRKRRIDWQKVRGWFRMPRKLKITLEGKIYILLTLGVGLAAINTGNNMLFLVLGFMLSLIIISGVISEMTLRRLEIRRKLPTLPWAGEICAIEISVHNRKWVPSFCIEVQDIASNFTIDRRCFFLKISGLKVQSTAYHCVFPRRGIYHFTGMVVMTRFPFSLFSKSYRIDDADDLIVAPHKIRVTTEVPEPVKTGEVVSGLKADRQDMEIFDIRPYFSGDDLRRINWKLSAHCGRLIITEGIEHNDKFISILFDDKLLSAVDAMMINAISPTLPPFDRKTKEKLPDSIFEHQVDLAASTAEAFAMQGYSLWFATRRKTIGPISPQQVAVVILEMATIVPQKEGPTLPELPHPPGGPSLYFNHPQVRLRHHDHFSYDNGRRPHAP